MGLLLYAALWTSAFSCTPARVGPAATWYDEAAEIYLGKVTEERPTTVTVTSTESIKGNPPPSIQVPQLRFLNCPYHSVGDSVLVIVFLRGPLIVGQYADGPTAEDVRRHTRLKSINAAFDSRQGASQTDRPVITEAEAVRKILRAHTIFMRNTFIYGPVHTLLKSDLPGFGKAGETVWHVRADCKNGRTREAYYVNPRTGEMHVALRPRIEEPSICDLEVPRSADARPSQSLGGESPAPRDLILDLGGGNSIRLVGKGNNFRCDDPEYADARKIETDTLVFANGKTLKLCRRAE
jgi:hypothetical protein